jgi:hypothetical protein
MRRAILTAALSGSLALLGACNGTNDTVTNEPAPGSPVMGSGRLVTEARPVAGFTAVSVSGAGNLIIEQTGVESLQITAEDNILQLIQSEVTDGRLVLGPVPGATFNTNLGVEYRLTVLDLDDIEASGASRVDFPSVATAELALTLSGASAFTGTGTVTTQLIDLSGASRYEAPSLQCRDVTAVVSGASYALIRVSDLLTANVSGASTLEYLGDPVVEAEVTGESTIRRVGS